MKQTSFSLPANIARRAQQKARERGVTLEQFVRESVLRSISDNVGDPFLDDNFVAATEGPGDVAENHDKYLGAIMDEHLTRNAHVTKRVRPRGRR